MRIAHICLAAFYIDGYGYQENILPRVHKRMGHDVEIIASTETYIDHSKLGHLDPSTYQNEDGITVHRLAYARWVPKRLQPKIRAYQNLLERLEEFAPDLIFLHDTQFWDILIIRKFAVAHGIPVHADSHTDYVNSARTFASRHLLHGLFYRRLVRAADSAIQKYFPTLPARADFMHEVYGLPREKMELLPFGCDDTAVAQEKRPAIRNEERERLGIHQDDLIFVSGGKLDLRKNIHILIDRFSRLCGNGGLTGVHLIVFGKPNAEVAEQLAKIDIDDNVHMVGWTTPDQLYKLFWAADLALFPGTHSVVWEEAVGHGLPAVFHKWKGMEHLDLGGNAIFVDDAEASTLDNLLRKLTENGGVRIREMAEESKIKGPRFFSFSKIAARALS